MRFARRVAVPECAGAVRFPVVAGRAVSAVVFGLTAAAVEPAVVASGLIAVAAEPAAVVSGPTAVAAEPAVVASGLTAAAVEPAVVVSGLTAVAVELSAAASGLIAVAVELFALGAWLDRTCSVFLRASLAFRPAAHAVRKREQRFREVKPASLC